PLGNHRRACCPVSRSMDTPFPNPLRSPSLARRSEESAFCGGASAAFRSASASKEPSIRCQTARTVPTRAANLQTYRRPYADDRGVTRYVTLFRNGVTPEHHRYVRYVPL